MVEIYTIVQVQMSDPNLTFKPVINKKSSKMVSNLR